MITTYLSTQEKETYSKVTDVDVNQLFQKVQAKQKLKKLYIREYTTTIKRWFSHPLIKKNYELYWDTNGNDYPEVQIMSFYPENEHQSTLNTVVPKHIVINYLYGILSGLNNG